MKELIFPTNKRKLEIESYRIIHDPLYDVDVIEVSLFESFIEYLEDDICYWILLKDDGQEVKIYFWYDKGDRIYGELQGMI